MQAFTPTDIISDCLTGGAGKHILRVPRHPDVPPPPDLTTLDPAPTPPAAPAPRILTGWSSVEELAEEHLRAIGIRNTHRTPPGADGGLDIDSPHVAAQVKATALPVGRPVLQQLIGASRADQDTVCYSTTGYTPDAREYADDRHIALYQITATGTVEPTNTTATRFELHYATGPEAAAWRTTDAYVTDVLIRTRRAYDHLPTLRRPQTGATVRAGTYLQAFHKALDDPPPFTTPREQVLHYHHAELLLATWAQHVHGRYPNNLPDLPTDGPTHESPTGLSDFY